MSVVKQLDVVDFDDLDPFGRIRLPTSDPRDGIDIVGRDKGTGVLARAIARTPKRPIWTQLHGEKDVVRVCRDRTDLLKIDPDTGRKSVIYDGQPVGLLTSNDFRVCRTEDHDEGRCAPLPISDVTGRIDTLVIEYRAAQRQLPIAEALPLIILAGLR